MKAIEDGYLSMDTKVNDVLPFKVIHPKYPNVPITVWHLVTHTSGIKNSFLPIVRVTICMKNSSLKRESYL